MTVNLRCTGCKSTLKVREDLAGKKVKCPRCATVLVVPTADEEFATVEVASDDRISKTPRSRLPDPTEDDSDDRRTRVRTGRKRDEEDDTERDDRRSAIREESDRDRKRKRRRDEDEEEDDDDDRGRGKKGKGSYKPCPKCGAEGARRVLWTAWGSFYGPALFTHVRCPECGATYNGRSGRSNLIPAIVFTSVPLLGILAILAAIVYMLVQRNYLPKFW